MREWRYYLIEFTGTYGLSLEEFIRERDIYIGIHTYRHIVCARDDVRIMDVEYSRWMTISPNVPIVTAGWGEILFRTSIACQLSLFLEQNQICCTICYRVIRKIMLILEYYNINLMCK